MYSTHAGGCCRVHDRNFSYRSDLPKSLHIHRVDKTYGKNLVSIASLINLIVHEVEI